MATDLIIAAWVVIAALFFLVPYYQAHQRRKKLGRKFPKRNDDTQSFNAL